MESHSHPFVSVIIPVYNDAERLKLCLEALENQTYPKTGYEVIVVDNASDEAADIKGVVAQFGQAIAAYESTPGSYAARNKGISLAKGEVIAFTDADCIPESDWIEKGVEHLLDVPNCGLVAGKIEIFFKDSTRLTTVELYESLMALPQQEFLENHRYGATANVFTWRNVIKDVGAFDASLKSSGDVEWGQRVHSYGYQQVYAEDTCVAHPARYSFQQLYKRTLRHIGGTYDLQMRRYSSSLKMNQMFMSSLFFNLTPPLQFALTVFRDPIIKNWNHKFKISLVMFFVRYVSAWELMRLKLGGVSERE
ncbi:glycosyltransferase [Coleofasciculus chthonoplastes]|uniref:glycosyltransferase n=1 Tax=Coleofasciculus chthonoplastes TaxID=64178 RepID=UPI0032FC55ED